MTTDDQRDYTDAVPFPTELTLRPIGVVESPYKQRHGTPRQARIPDPHPTRQGALVFFPDVVPATALKDLNTFDYVWVLTFFHLNIHWNPMVKAPKGPRVKRGVLATRAPHRPNPIGLSAVKILSVDGHRVEIEELDILDGTPILDIKPYLPYCDALPNASHGWVSEVLAGLPQSPR